MKNTNKLKFIIALAVITGLIMTACDNSTDEGEGGNLTITGIPAVHNGRHALFMHDSIDDDFILLGYVSINMQNETATLPRISGGSVTIPIWRWDRDDNVERFTGDMRYVRGWLSITTDATVSFHDIDSGHVSHEDREWNRIIFQDGNANITWGSGTAPGQ